MFSYVLNTIPHLLFFPVAFCALGGVVLSLFSKRKKTDVFWIILFAVVFMFGWRFVCNDVLFSTRYSSILFYPALILTAYFCFRVRTALFYCSLKSHLFRDVSIIHRICLFIPYLVLLGLSIACMVKAFQFDPKFRGILRVCQTYMEDRAGKDIVFTYYINGSEQNRIRHYAQINDYREPVKLCKKETTYDLIMKAIRDKRNIEGTHYFFYFKNADDMDLLPSDDILSAGEWREVCRYDVSSKRKVDFILYSYTPYCKNIELWDKEIPNMSPNNLCPNGDFEQILPEKELETRVAYYKSIEASDFFTAPKELFPNAWWINVLKPESDDPSELSLTAEQPLAGKYSLEIRGSEMISANSTFIGKMDCIVTGFIRVLEDSDVVIYSKYRDMDESFNVTIDDFLFTLSAGKTYRFSLPILEKDVPVEDKWINITFCAKGHVLLDNVEFIKQVPGAAALPAATGETTAGANDGDDKSQDGQSRKTDSPRKRPAPAAVPVISLEELEKLNSDRNE